MPPDPSLAAHIARRLAETANRQKVIEETCLEQHLYWEDARQLVDEVLISHRLEITRQQSPLLFLLAVIIFADGVGLVSWNLQAVLTLFSFALAPQNLSANAFQSLQAFGWLLTGLGMIAGSLLGMKEVWLALFDAWDRRLSPLAVFFSAPSAASPSSAAGADTPSPLPDQALDYALEQLQSEADAPALAQKLQENFGLTRPAAYALLLRILRLKQIRNQGLLSPGWILAALAACVAGAVWVIQGLVSLSAYLRDLPAPWPHLFWVALTRLYQLAGYIRQFPASFALLAAGLILLIGGGYILRHHWPAIFAWPGRFSE